MAWVFWAGSSWRGPNAGLARRDWSLNEAGQRYEALMREWSTHASGVTDENGVFACSAFLGDYDFTCDANRYKIAHGAFTLSKGTGSETVAVDMRGNGP